MPRTPRLHLTLSSATAALALAVAGASAEPADARAAVKAAAPKLTIEAKQCLIGPATEDRSATVTAMALLGATGERVTMRFTVQARQGKTKWRTLLLKDATTKRTWETTDAAGAGLRLTKTIPELEEGFQYRVGVEARSIDAKGKVVTKTAKRTYTCVQPLFSPAVGLVSAKDQVGADASHLVLVTLRNAGRTTSKPVVITVRDLGSRAVLTQYTAEPVEGADSVTVKVPYGDCDGTSGIYVTAQEEGAGPSSLRADQTTTASCAQPPGTRNRR